VRAAAGVCEAAQSYGEHGLRANQGFAELSGATGMDVGTPDLLLATRS
jgi:hypothetical protein